MIFSRFLVSLLHCWVISHTFAQAFLLMTYIFDNMINTLKSLAHYSESCILIPQNNFNPIWYFRSNCREVVFKKAVVKVSQNSQGHTSKVVLYLVNLLKRRLNCRCILVNFARFSKTTIGIIHLVRTQNFLKNWNFLPTDTHTLQNY